MNDLALDSQEKPFPQHENNTQEKLPVNEMLRYMYHFGLTGHVIDHTWYKFVKREPTKKSPKGRPHPAAISILSDIFYWYRPTDEKDQSGNLTLKKKFRSDILQRSYEQIEDSLGFTKEEARSGLETLERLGICKRVLRTINVGGVKVSNVMFISFNPIRLRELIDDELKKSIPLSFKTDEGVGFKPLPPRLKPTTNTESSSKTSQRKNNKQPTAVRPAAAVAVFSCLKDKDIPEKEKIWITKNYTEKRVANAIAFIEQPSTKIETTYVQMLKWACKEQPKVIEIVSAEENRRKAVNQILPFKRCDDSWSIEALNKNLEFTPINNLKIRNDGSSFGGEKGKCVYFPFDKKYFCADVAAFIKENIPSIHQKMIQA